MLDQYGPKYVRVGVLYYHRKTQILSPPWKYVIFLFLTTFQNMLLVFVYHAPFA